MKNNLLISSLIFLGAMSTNCNSNKIIINSQTYDREVYSKKLNANTNHDWYEYNSYQKGEFKYIFYYDLNNIKYVEVFTGVSIEVYDNIDTQINYSITQFTTSSVEKGDIDNIFGTNVSVTLGTAVAELEYNFEKTFGITLESTFSETISSSLTSNELDGCGTYYLYQNVMISNCRVEQKHIRTNKVLCSMEIDDVCDQSTFRLELSKKQPKINLPLLGKC